MEKLEVLMIPEATEAAVSADELATESLIEEVSIDGMCGVY